MIVTVIKKFLVENKRTIPVFMTVGLFVAFFYFALFSLLWKFLHINYNIAVSVAYVSSVILHFYSNRRFTFRVQDKMIGAQLLRYVFLVILNYVVTMVIVGVVVEIILLPPYIGVISALVVTTGISFLMSKFWVFQRSMS